MRYLILAAAILACAPAPKSSQPPTVGGDTVQAPPMDSTVQHKIAPDTLVRGDGARCVVRPAVKWQAVELGAPYICDWRK